MRSVIAPYKNKLEQCRTRSPNGPKRIEDGEKAWVQSSLGLGGLGVEFCHPLYHLWHSNWGLFCSLTGDDQRLPDDEGPGWNDQGRLFDFYGVGAMVSPVLTGHLADVTGTFRWSFGLGAFTSLTAAVLIRFLKKKKAF